MNYRLGIDVLDKCMEFSKGKIEVGEEVMISNILPKLFNDILDMRLFKSKHIETYLTYRVKNDQYSSLIDSFNRIKMTIDVRSENKMMSDVDHKLKIMNNEKLRVSRMRPNAAVEVTYNGKTSYGREKYQLKTSVDNDILQDGVEKMISDGLAPMCILKYHHILSTTHSLKNYERLEYSNILLSYGFHHEKIYNYWEKYMTRIGTPQSKLLEYKNNLTYQHNYLMTHPERKLTCNSMINNKLSSAASTSEKIGCPFNTDRSADMEDLHKLMIYNYPIVHNKDIAAIPKNEKKICPQYFNARLNKKLDSPTPIYRYPFEYTTFLLRKNDK
jgi:hypothetical protein